ncbi:glycosyltransferase family 2 protein [Leeuwenhoekiella marinoflava]|uniref:Glycosyltransferase involved in cell wall biosynthesis n=2 Tax=Leeuwenhoekiella marinoflava TaxID=988 RepID=A0A4Q0PKB5_9FLAO|nr:glycosyltransferase family A protein [Leeuwenhoekiella marinoflava]RXG26916.1 glycosyltransferase involved in cell wall biosynthesis [Leeuwenhoekiella marinoflava]SHF41072.1 Glycosyltransferase involved in cell wall bisynthesis [Leeuwenhoekiella marinoflava DSM 3653]
MGVSIIIPLYNKEKYVLDTLISVQNQVFKDWECIIVDDGSTDNSFHIVKGFIKSKSNFKLYKRPDDRIKGASTCRNIGLKFSTMTFIQYLDADDILAPFKLKFQIDLIKLYSSNVVSICKWGRIDFDEYLLHENLSSYDNFNSIPDFLNALIKDYGYFPPNAYLIPKSLIEIAGPWNENLSLNDDGEFIMRILSHTKQIIFSSESIAWYRTRTENNLSSFGNLDSVRRGLLSWKLIDTHLDIALEERQKEFVLWNLKSFYRELKLKKPEYLQDLKPFFEEIIVQDSMYSILKRKIINLLKFLFVR